MGDPSTFGFTIWEGICDRSQGVQDELFSEVHGTSDEVTDCKALSDDELARLVFQVVFTVPAEFPLKDGDFLGLSACKFWK